MFVYSKRSNLADSYEVIIRIPEEIKLKEWNRIQLEFGSKEVALIVNGVQFNTVCKLNLDNTNRILYLGGIDSTATTSSGNAFITPDFKGIVSIFKIDQAHIDFFSSAVVKSKKNVHAFNTCHNVNCQNGGVCITTQNDVGFRCKCGEANRGQFCEKDRHVSLCEQTNPCENEGKCVESRDKQGNTSLKCVCLTGYSGRNCTRSIN